MNHAAPREVRHPAAQLTPAARFCNSTSVNRAAVQMRMAMMRAPTRAAASLAVRA